MNNNYFNYGFNFNQNDFTGKYVSSYEEVINEPAPINGTPVILADLNNMMLYSKKNINGTVFIQPYKIQPVYQEVQKPAIFGTENEYSTLISELKSLKEEISKLKGDNYESKQSITNSTIESIEKQKPTSL